MMMMIICEFLIPLILIIVFSYMTKNALKLRAARFLDQKSFIRLNKLTIQTDSNSCSANRQPLKNNNNNNLDDVICVDDGVQKLGDNEYGEEADVKSTMSKIKMNESIQFKIKIENENKFKCLFIKSEIKVIRRILLGISLFLFAWLPYVVITGYAQFGFNIETVVTPYTTFLPALFAKLSSVFNPILYLLHNVECRKYLYLKISRKNFETSSNMVC